MDFNNKPLVMQILPELETGGVERGTIELAAALTEMKWANIVVSSGGGMVRELERMGVEHIKLPVKTKNPLTVYKNIARLEAIIKEKKVGLIHARSRIPAFSAYYACKRAGIPFVTTFHGTYGLGSFGIKKPYNAIMTKGLRVIAISSFIAEHIAKNYNISLDKIRTVHRGVDTNKFDASKVSGERIIRLAKIWRIPEDLPIITLPGRLTRWKGQTILIDAISKLNRSDFHCVLLGSDQGRKSYRKELEKMIKNKCLSGVVHIVDNCDDMPAAYMLSDIVISASTDPEAFGRVAIESQSNGKFVIETSQRGSFENIKDGETVFLVPPADADALAQKIDAVLNMTLEDKQKIAAKAIASAKEEFATSRMCAGEIAVYNEIIKELQN